MNAKRAITAGLAATITSIAVAMSAIAGLERGGTVAEKTLLVAVSVAVALLVHLLPSLSKNRFIWAIWLGCFLATTYGQLTFFSNAQTDAGEIRAVNNLQNRDLSTQTALIAQERDSIVTRPITTILPLLERVTDWKERATLKNELAEAKRRISLTDQLIKLNEKMENTHVIQSNDRVTVLLSRVTGSNGSEISLLVGIFFAVLIDLSGVILWREVFNSSNDVTQKKDEAESLALVTEQMKISLAPETKTTIETDTTDDTLTALKQAIEAGVCKPTVAAIRVYAGVGQARACELRKQLETA